jgi:hypothetical protein
MSKITKIIILCSTILLVLLSGCKNFPQTFANYKKVNLKNKVSFLVPADIAKTCKERSYYHNSVFSNEYQNKELEFNCSYFTNSCPPSTLATLFDKQLKNPSFKNFEKEISGKKAIIQKIRGRGILDYEYWKTKAIHGCYNLDLDLGDCTFVYFFDIDNQKSRLKLCFSGLENHNDIVDNIINSIQFLE